MNPIKLGAIILILTAGLAGGYLIIKDSKTAGSGSYITLESSGKAVENSPKSPIQWMEKAKEFISNPIESLGLNDKTDGNNLDNTTSFNLTEFVAKSVSNQMQTLDQKGVENIDPNDPQNQEAIKKAMAELQNFSLFEGTVDDKDLKISSDNSGEAKKKYIENTSEIAQNNFSGFKNSYVEVLEDVVKRGDFSSVKQLSEIYQKIVNSHINLTAPSDLLYLHKKLINHFMLAHKIYQSIANLQVDPIRADLAFQMIEHLVANAEANQKLIEEEYKKVQ